MMRRHIIVEGPDGSGKDTLIHNLGLFFPTYQLNKRASTSMGGPVNDLEQWVVDDLASLPTKPTSLYNRHPLVSETIYHDIRKVNPGTTPNFRSRSWLTGMQTILGQHALLVICLPPYTVVERQADMGEHMPGVRENLPIIYARYASFAWPGHTIRYDRTSNSVESLAATISRTLGVTND